MWLRLLLERVCRVVVQNFHSEERHWLPTAVAVVAVAVVPDTATTVVVEHCTVLVGVAADVGAVGAADVDVAAAAVVVAGVAMVWGLDCAPRRIVDFCHLESVQSRAFWCRWCCSRRPVVMNTCSVVAAATIGRCCGLRPWR
jgi:hypothetical protein